MIILLYYIPITYHHTTAGLGSEAVLQSGKELSRGVHQERGTLRGVMRPSGDMIYFSFSYSMDQKVQPCPG